MIQRLNSPHDAVEWLRSRVTGTLQTDSRLVAPGDGFIAWPGAATDGRAHVADAWVRGATACLVEHAGVENFALAGEHIASLQDLKAATGPLAAQWFGHASTRLDVLAVTGTNGKTSTAWWLADALNLLAQSRDELGAAVGKRCAIVGTLGMGLAPALTSTGMTTPDPVRLQRAFAEFADQGLGACAIEASSIGIAERRLDGTQIRVAVFTNNDDGLRTVNDLKAKGLNVTLIDARKGDEVIDSAGRLGLKRITVRRSTGKTETLHVSALGVSGGWNPNLNIASNHRGRPVWDDQIAAFIPAPESIAGLSVVGAAAGAFSTHAALTMGADQAIAALADLGLTAHADTPAAEDAPLNLTPAWYVHSGKGRAWVDPQNDVTVKDVKLAKQEGFISVEHLKRYTTLAWRPIRARPATSSAWPSWRS